MQSINEELSTVNAELQAKVLDLSRANNDMNNLLAVTGIATVFVDHRLRILRFTPAATKIINLIQSDIGRPIDHIVTNLTGYEHLTADAQDVLDTLIPKELDVQSAEGRWYTMRIQPYRTMDNVIEGAVFTFVDVTATRKLQKQLQKSEELLNASQRLSMAGGWEWNVETQCMYWTEETYRIHDFVPGEMDPGSAEHINRSTECYEPDDRPVIMAAFQRCSEDGQPYDLELPFTTAKGRRIWIRTTARPVIESGKVIRVIGNIMDITERKLAEESLRSSELKFRTLVESSSLGIWKTDAAGRNIYVSPRCCEIAGISEANADGQSWMSNLHPDDRIQVRIGWAAAITAAMPYADEFRFVHPDGRLVWVLCQASPFMVEGHPVEWIGTITDITARIEAEEARREIEQKYRTLHELSPDAYIVGEITVDGRDLGFVDCNQAALDMLGITRDQLLAADVASLSPERQPDGRLSREKAGEMISRCMVKGSLRFDWLHVRAGGEPFPVEITMIIYRERGKIFQHSVWRDLTGFTRPEPPKEHPVATHQEEKRP
jgi:PAS domain S-box-containing protein